MKTYEQQTLLFGEDELTCSQEDFPASHIVQQESEKAQQMNATYGRKCLEQFERFPRAGSWQKTFAALLIGMEGWSSTRCRLTWKLKATRCSRFFFQLQVSERRIEGTGFGLLHTPRAVMIEEPKQKTRKNSMKTGLNLAQVVKLLPTPRSSEHKGVGPMGSKSHAHRLKKGYLDATIQELTGDTFQLNPLFVQEMMGFPTDWLTSPFQSGETKA